MHSPKRSAGETSQQTQRAIHFSFPPTQRTRLLRSTTARSSDQRLNLQRSYQKLVDALTVQPLQQARAR